MEKKQCVAVALAGGRGKRMGSAVSKQYLLLGGKPVLYYSLKVFQDSAVIDDVILVAGKGQIAYCREHVVDKYGFSKVRAIVEGGQERYHSVWAGLRAVEDMKQGYIFIHDTARPFVDEAMLLRAYEEVERSGACVVGMPVKDTIKIASEQGIVKMTPKRSLVWQIQTPQVFSSRMIIPAYREVIEHEKELLAQGVQITDDAMVVETICKCPVHLVEGSYENIKITTPEDLKLAEGFLS